LWLLHITNFQKVVRIITIQDSELFKDSPINPPRQESNRLETNCISSSKQYTMYKVGLLHLWPKQWCGRHREKQTHKILQRRNAQGNEDKLIYTQIFFYLHVEPKIATRPLFVLHLQADILEKFRHFS
jgi:hypothetical protein